MKKTITTITLGLALSLSSFATVFTVNNSTTTPGNPGQYATIETAFAAASPGDTLLVKGSLIPYTLAPSTSSGTLLINKRICIIGEGYKPKGIAEYRSIISGTFSFSSISASGTSILGLYGADIRFSSTSIRLNNITIRRNFLTNISLSDSTYNTVIAENIFSGFISLNSGGPYDLPKHVNLKISNNIFVGANNGVMGNSYAYEIKNNLFLYGTFSSPLSSNPTSIMSHYGASNGAGRMTNAVISNNFFYNKAVYNTNLSTGYYAPISCSFNNNISYCAITNTTFSSISGNSSSGNLDNTDPGYTNLFTNITANKIINGYDLFNIRISNSSPAKNAGTDGTDIGPTGGAYPIYNNVLTNEQLSGEPPLPQVRSANFTNNINAVQTGGTLQINVTGRKRN